MLANHLEDNTNVKVLDLSFNAICGTMGMKRGDKKCAAQRALAAQDWANCFKNNMALMHVDISHNDLQWPEMEVIGEGLKDNHTILGIHVRGNEAQVDSRGFIERLSSYQYAEMVMEKGIKSGKPGAFNEVQQQIDAHNNCWICGGWTEVEFQYTPGISDDRIDLSAGEEHDQYIPMNLQLDCDNFTGDLLAPQPKGATVTADL